MRYALFLRGINLGAKNKVKMSELKVALESLGFTEVKTLLNSGNAVFTSKEESAEKLAETIEKTLEKKFGFPIDAIVRTESEMKRMLSIAPFRKLGRYWTGFITLFGSKPKGDLSIPYAAPEGDFEILALDGNDLYSIREVIPGRFNSGAMGIIDEKFGKKHSTTRNWNTILKVGKAL